MIEQQIQQSYLIDRTLPSFVLDNFKTFAEFARRYYVWLEQNRNVADRVNKYLSETDIDTYEYDESLVRILNNWMETIPPTLNIDYSILLHNIRKFYNTRGNESSISVFFSLFNDLYTPLRLLVEYDEEVGMDHIVGKEVRGSSSGSVALVNKAIKIFGSTNLYWLYVSYARDAHTKNEHTRFFTSADTIIVSETQEEIKLIQEDFALDIFYPKERLLKASDGIYDRSHRVRIKTLEDGPINFSGRRYTTSRNYGRIETSKFMFFRGGYSYYELGISFADYIEWDQEEEFIDIEGTEYSLLKFPIGVTIVDSGTGYSHRDTFFIRDESGYKQGELVITELLKTPIQEIIIEDGGSMYNVGELCYMHNSAGKKVARGVVQATTQGRITEIGIEWTSQDIYEPPTVKFLSGNNSARISMFSTNMGGVRKITFRDMGVESNSNWYVDIPLEIYPKRSTVLTLHHGTLFESDPYYKELRGSLSSEYVMQDNFYWQDFSYLLRVNKPIDFGKYFGLYKKLVHPAGTKPFLEIITKSKLDMGIQKAEMQRHIKRQMETLEDVLDVPMEETGVDHDILWSGRIKDRSLTKVIAEMDPDNNPRQHHKFIYMDNYMELRHGVGDTDVCEGDNNQLLGVNTNETYVVSEKNKTPSRHIYDQWMFVDCEATLEDLNSQTIKHYTLEPHTHDTWVNAQIEEE